MRLSFAAAQAYLLATVAEAHSPHRTYGLERMTAFARELGEPQCAYPTIHVGGTSGKGSTATLIAAALQAQGLRVGLHTKPHLRSITERARVNGENIGEERFAALLEEMLPIIERIAATHGRPSYYETTLALAFLYFARERVDAAVIEVGLGGRLDGTNILVPEVAVITSIGFDHMDVLGDSLEKIAAEKAGIAKPKIPLVVAVDDSAAFDTIAMRARAVGAPLISARDNARVDVSSRQLDGEAFCVTTARATYALALPVLGEFQRRNAATAIMALEQLPDHLRPGVAAIEEGFSRVKIPGRMEFIPGNQSIIFDIAHTADKAQHLALSLCEHFPDRRFHFVVAIGESKDAREILRALSGVQGRFTMTTFETTGRQAIHPQRLATMAASLNIEARPHDDPIAAFTAACNTCASDEIVVVTGSTFVVAQLRAWLLDRVVEIAVAR